MIIMISSSEYNNMCEQILKSTIGFLDTNSMRSYRLSKSDAIHSDGDAIYTSAVVSSAPITLAYIPAGAGKSLLVSDRVHALKSAGVPANKIMLLNMNIAKVKQMRSEIPDVNIMTFSDFTHNIFACNHHCEVTDTNSVINLLRMIPQTENIRNLTTIMAMSNQQDRSLMLTLFVNRHLKETIEILETIGKTDYTLESIIVQNEMYSANTPYNIESIIINGAHNMPVHTLCAVLEYANRFHCNIFMTGMPEETIYEFNMAYPAAMNILSAYSPEKRIDIIHINRLKKMSKEIHAVCNMLPISSIKGAVSMTNMNTDEKEMTEKLAYTAAASSIFYIEDKIANGEQVLILARSNSEIARIKKTLTDMLARDSVSPYLLDLTEIQYPDLMYGTIAAQIYNDLMTRYPAGITPGQLFYEIYNIIAKNIETTDADAPIQTRYQYNKEQITNFTTRYFDKELGATNKVQSVPSLIHKLIEIEADITKQHIATIENNTTLDISHADIILSTIHTASDLRCNNVVAILHNFNNNFNRNVYRVALSRANKTEHVIFINHGTNKTDYQQYIEDHLK